MANAQILIVEDEETVAGDIQCSLQRLGYDVLAVASSGEEAIEKAQEAHPDLVLMDIRFEGDMDGGKATENFRDRFDIPVIYLSADEDNQLVQRAKITEPFACLIKPVQEKELYSSIELALYKHRMESKLKENDQSVTRILDSLGEAVVATDIEGCVTFMNPDAETLLGWRQKGSLGKAITEVFHTNGNTLTHTNIPVAKTLKEGIVVTLSDLPILGKGGSKVLGSGRIVPIRDNKANITGAVLVFRKDGRTGQERVAREESEERFHRLSEAAFEGIAIHDKGEILEVNEQFAQMFGYELSEVIGMLALDFAAPESHELISKNILSSYEEPYEAKGKKKDGTTFPIEIRGKAIPFRGRVARVTAIRDISERKKSEEALRESEDRYRAIFEQAADSIVLVDAKTGKMKAFNRMAHENLGYTREEFQELEIHDFEVFESVEEVTRHAQKVREEGAEVFETKHKTKKGEIRNILVTTRTVYIGGKTYLQGIWRDITERKRAEEVLKQAHDELETRVAERTQELTEANEKLKIEIADRELIEKEMQIYQIKLEMQNRKLQQTYVKLEDSVARYRELYDFAPVGYLALDDKGFIRQINLTGASILGIERSRLTGKPFDLHVDKSDRLKLRKHLEETLQTDKEVITELNLVVKSGGMVPVELQSRSVQDDKQDITLCKIVFTDISKRKLAEMQLRESEEHFRQMAENINEGFWMTDSKTKQMIYISPAFERIWGRSWEDLYEEQGSILASVHPDDRRRVRAANRKQERGKYDEKYRIVRPDGSVRWIWDRAYPIRNPLGEIYRIAGIAEDITDHKQMEDALLQSEKRYRQFFEEDLSGHVVTTPEGEVIACNLVYARMLGFESVEEAMKVDVHTTYTNPTMRTKVLRQLKKKRKILDSEKELVRRDGKIIWVTSNVIGTFDENDELAEIREYVYDITDRKQAEEKIVLLSNAVRSVNECITITDKKCNIIYVNRAFEKTYGYTMEELLGQNVTMIRSGSEQQKDVETILPATLKGGWQGELQNKCKDGRVFPISLSTSVVRDEQEKPVALIGVARDITEQQRVNEKLRMQAHVLESMAEGVNLSDTDGYIVFSNPAFDAMFGYKRGELIGKHVSELNDYPPEENDKIVSGIIEKLNTHGVYRGEIRNRKKNGESFISEGHITKVTMANGTDCWISVQQDITKRKNAEEELKRSATRLRNLSLQLQSLRETERSSIARQIHDQLGQELTGLRMEISWLTKRISDAEEFALRSEVLEKLASFSKTADSLVVALQKIATELRPAVLDLLGLGAAIQWQAREFQTRAAITCNVKLKSRTIMMGKEQSAGIFRIFQEMLTNIARHAKATKVNVCLKEKKETVLLEVCDNGIGITEEQISSPTSLGILGMRERAGLYGGELKITNTPTGGTIASVEIPLANSRQSYKFMFTE